MIKKYSLYALVALLGAVSMDTGAVIRPSQIPAVQNYVTTFTALQMGRMFTRTQRFHTTSYTVTSDGVNVDVQRTPSAMSATPRQATDLFDQAITAIVDAILEIYDENGFAERIGVSASSNNQNVYRFTPHFMGSFESDSGEDTEEDNDNQNIGEDNANTISYKGNVAA